MTDLVLFKSTVDKFLNHLDYGMYLAHGYT